MSNPRLLRTKSSSDRKSVLYARAAITLAMMAALLLSDFDEIAHRQCAERQLHQRAANVERAKINREISNGLE